MTSPNLYIWFMLSRMFGFGSPYAKIPPPGPGDSGVSLNAYVPCVESGGGFIPMLLLLLLKILEDTLECIALA